MNFFWNSFLGYNLSLCPQGPGDAGAEAYPTKPLRFIVPYAVGGPGDILARLIGRKLGERWNQHVEVENVPGKGGSVGAAAALKAPADGHTLIRESALDKSQPLR